MSEEIPKNTPEKKEVLDDNARKFVVEPIDSTFLDENSATSFTLTVDWLETGDGNEKKVAYKKFANGDTQILLISKVTIDGNRTSKKVKITDDQYGELVKSSIIHLNKTRYEFSYTQDGAVFAMKYDVFDNEKLCMLEVDSSSAEDRGLFEPVSFPYELADVSSDKKYTGFRVAETLQTL